MSDDPGPGSEPMTEAVERASTAAQRAAGAGKRLARDRHPSRIDEASVPDEASGAAEPDTTDMDATGDGGQVFGG